MISRTASPSFVRTSETRRYSSTEPSSFSIRVLFLLLAWIFAVCLTVATLPIFQIEPRLALIALLSFVTIALLSVLTWGRNHTIVFLALLLLGALWFSFFTGVPLTQRLEDISRFIARGIELMNNYASALNEGAPLTAQELKDLAIFHHFMTQALSIFFATLAYLVVGRLKWPWIMTLLVAAILTVKLVMGREAQIFWLLPAALITMWTFVWSNRVENQGGQGSIKHFLQLSLQTGIPLALAVIITAGVVPRLDYWQVYSPTLQSITEDFVALLPQNQDERFEIYNFSIRQAGYYPLGSRLGGPLELTDAPLLEVWGEPGYFMKGTSANIYDGHSWSNEMTNPHYRFNSAFNVAEQRLVMPTEPPILDYLKDETRENVSYEYQYALRPIMDSVQVIFSDGVLTDIKTQREEPNQFYFNQSGLVYAKDIYAGKFPYWANSFSLQPSIIPGYYQENPYDAKGTAYAYELNEAIGRLEADGKVIAEQEHAAEHYLQLPENSAYHAGGHIRNLSERLTQGTRTDYEKVLKIFNYLARNDEFTYSTEVVVPPQDSDFVSHFLTTRVGYCTYYATTMTMMARTLGIPARYVEGFSVAPELQAELKGQYKEGLDHALVEEGTILDKPNITLRAENAHAWTEVFLHGIGWVAIDPTPGGAGGNSLPILHEEKPEPLSPTPTPEPNQTGTPTPTPVPDEELSPTPQASPTPTEDPDDPNIQSQKVLHLVSRILLTLLILAALLAAAYIYYKNRLARRVRFHSPEQLAELVPDSRDRAITYWTQITRLLSLLEPGDPPARLSLSEQTAWQLSQKQDVLKPVREDLVLATRMAQRAYFSQHAPSDEDLTDLADAFDHVEDLVEATLSKPAYLFQRLLKPGSFVSAQHRPEPPQT